MTVRGGDSYFPVRTPLPADVVRQIDRLIRQGRVPFDTREEFIEEAVRQMLLELESYAPPRQEWQQRLVDAPAELAHRTAEGDARLAWGPRFMPDQWEQLAQTASV